tara:strand:- start:144 stop:353 length:210 start_codon:yes stop_codon:yes gene_type:complete
LRERKIGGDDAERWDNPSPSGIDLHYGHKRNLVHVTTEGVSLLMLEKKETSPRGPEERKAFLHQDHDFR